VVDATQPGYRSAHLALYRERGSASSHWCVDRCGRRAVHWSFAFTTATEQLVDDLGRIYSSNVDDYEPRCRPCHSWYDTTGAARTTAEPTGVMIEVSRFDRLYWFADG
jgi:hypothetical protein